MREGVYTTQTETKVDGQQPMANPISWQYWEKVSTSAGSRGQDECRAADGQSHQRVVSRWMFAIGLVVFFDMCVYLFFGQLWEVPDFRKTI